MIDFTAVTDDFVGLVGWRQDQDGPTLDAALIATDSGLTFNRHPCLTINNLKAIAPDAVRTAVNDTTFNTWLTTETKEAIKESIAHWWSSKWSANTAKPLLGWREAYRYDTYSEYNTVASGSALGVRVTPMMKYSRLGQIRIDKVAIRLSSPATVTVKFQPVNGTDPTRSQVVSYTGNGEEQWVAVTDWTVKGDSLGAYIYYETDGTTPMVITYRGNCNCKMSSPYLSVTGITGIAGQDPFKPAVTRENYGLNLRLTAECDYTEFLTDNKDLFADYLSLSVATHFLRLMATNPTARLNRNEGMMDTGRILYEIDGDPQGRRTGLGLALSNATDAVHLDKNGQDETCLPCDSQAGISRLKTG